MKSIPDPLLRPNLRVVGAIQWLFGLLCFVLAAAVGLLAVVGYFSDDSAESRTVAAVFGGLAVVLLVIGLRSLRRGDGTGRRAKRAKPSPCTIEGWWCETAIRLPKPVKTPLGGRVTSVTVCVDVRYEVQNGDIIIHGVSLAMPKDGSFNVAAERRGEAWLAARICDDSELLEVVRRELYDGSRLRKVMLGQKRDRKSI